jgi:hypothetical protein
MKRAGRAYERLHRQGYPDVLAALQQCDDANAKEIRELRRLISDQIVTIAQLTDLLKELSVSDETINAALKKASRP